MKKESKPKICKVCQNKFKNKEYICKEMMYGYRDKFNYFKCAKCGCLQLNEDIETQKYYKKDYYSYTTVQDHAIAVWARRKAITGLAFKKNVWGSLIIAFYQFIKKQPFPYMWLKGTKLSKNSRILDVGCGNGEILKYLSQSGFINLSGVDPYIPKNIKNKDFKVFKKELSEISGHYDLIMFNHSLEHMHDQHKVFQTLTKLVAPKGMVLIRIPLSDSHAWEIYKTNWVQLDAPRHIYLHTIKSIKKLLEKYRLKIVSMYYDSNAFQFWGSEQYLRDIPLYDQNSYAVNPKASIFSKHQINKFKKRAQGLNKSKKGDQLCLLLQLD